MKKDNEMDPLLYKVARQGGTEPPFSGRYWNNHEPGVYRCAVCDTGLFNAETKFDSGTGWPSFANPQDREKVVLREDNRLGMKRTEVVCKKCGAHLGHVFDDGPAEQGGKRYCINSVCLNLDSSKD